MYKKNGIAKQFESLEIHLHKQPNWPWKFNSKDATLL